MMGITISDTIKSILLGSSNSISSASLPLLACETLKPADSK